VVDLTMPVLCRFQTTTDERHGWTPLAEWIVQQAHRLGLAGATLFEGFAGFRLDGVGLHEHRWTLAQHRPVIVEVVDQPGALSRLLQVVEPAFQRGTITLESVHVRPAAVGDRSPERAANLHALTAETGTDLEVTTMNLPEAGVLLRIFIGESDRQVGGHAPLYEAIVRKAREAGLAGATVLRGAIGFGRHARMHTSKLLELSTDLPIVIEIVDAEDRVRAFLPAVEGLVGEGLVTLEPVRVLKYASRARTPPAE
jgi:PII-like signaling protein